MITSSYKLLLLREGHGSKSYGYGSIPIHTIFRGMNIHLPAILMFTRGTRVLTHCHIDHTFDGLVPKLIILMGLW